MSQSLLTCVVPYRASGDPARERNRDAVLRWLLATGMRVVLSEESSRPLAAVPPGVDYVWSESPQSFSKAAACNAGVLASQSRVVALVDADTMVRSRALLTSARLIDRAPASRPLGAVRPFGALIDLDESESVRVAESGEVPSEVPVSTDSSRRHERIPLAGGILVIDRETYLSAGGMDETFRGWGGEDDAFSRVLERLGVVTRRLTSETAYHLWHARSIAERYQHEGYAHNFNRALWWHRCGDADFLREVHHMESRLRARV